MTRWPQLAGRRSTRGRWPDDRYRSIFENAVEGIYQSLPAGGFLSVNPALAQLLGYATPEAMIDAVPDAARLYVRPGRRDEFTSGLHTKGLLVDWESEVYRADGTRLWISEHARAVCDTDGMPVRYEGTFEDITARREAEESARLAETRFRSLVQKSSDIVAIVDGDAVVRREEVEFFVDAQSADFLRDATLDFQDGLTGAGFRIVNPNAARTCGCGTSFESARPA